MDGAGEIVIARSRPVVAEFLFDDGNAPLWAKNVVACRQLTPGPVRPGTRIEQVNRMFGTNTAFTYEVVSMQTDRFFELRMDDPFELWVLQELEDVAGGTLVRIRTKRVGGDPLFFRLFGPVLSYLTRRRIAHDLRKLKQVLESRPA